MIETRMALDNLQAIVATPGVDAVFAGPADLALDLGVPISLPMHASVLGAIDKIVAACAASGVLPGAASFSLQNAAEFHRQGMRLLTLGADAGYAYLRAKGPEPMSIF